MSDPKRAWLERLGVAFATGRSDGDDDNADGSGADADAQRSRPSSTASATAGTAALPADETNLFFKFDEAELTPDDRAALDSYAAKYVAARSVEPVRIEGWASTDGQAARNAALAGQRAQAVADYFVSKGIPKGSITAKGMGPTDLFDKSNPASNRRATVSPNPPVIPPPAPAPKLDLLSPEAQKSLQDMADQMDEADAWIRHQLTTNGLRPDPVNTSGDKVYYRNKTTALTDVIKDTVDAGRSAPIKSPGMVTPQRVQHIAGEVLLAAAPGGGKMGGKSLVNISVYLQYQFIPKTLHTPISGGPGTADQPASQVQFQITAELHGKDESGIEISGNVSGTFFADDKGKKIEWQSATGGAQIAWVQTFLEGNLQVGPQLQISFGASRAVMNQSQQIEWTPTGQVSAGLQAQFKVPGFNGHLLVGWQAGGAITAPAGGNATADRSVGFTLTYQF